MNDVSNVETLVPLEGSSGHFFAMIAPQLRSQLPILQALKLTALQLTSEQCGKPLYHFRPDSLEGPMVFDRSSSASWFSADKRVQFFSPSQILST